MKILLIALLAIVVSACGDYVSVPPAHVGKILTKNGFTPETITPSKFRLEPCWAYCDALVTLEVSDAALKESISVFMPKDKLKLRVDIRGTYSIPNRPVAIASLFDRIPAIEGKIEASRVYSVYGQQALRGIVRSEITKYTIQDVLANREAIGKNIHSAIVEQLKVNKTPLLISRFQLADLKLPEVIINAQVAAKAREIDIQKANADAEVELVKAARDLEIAKKNRLVEREKAEAIAEQNRIAAKSITAEVLAYKKLETAETIYLALAKSGNTIIIPADSSGFSNTTSNAVLAKLLGKEVKK